MKTEDLGELFFDGRIVNLDKASTQDIDELLLQLNQKEEAVINKLNRVLAEIQ